MEIHGLSMLNCLITIGDEDPNDTLHILNKITVNEVVNLQIKDSYQTLINTATVEFTRQITIKSSLKDEFGTREVKLVGDKDSLFKRGKRINIKLCYGIDENLKTMFDGYITSIISGNPFTLEPGGRSTTKTARSWPSPTPRRQSCWIPVASRTL